MAAPENKKGVRQCPKTLQDAFILPVSPPPLASRRKCLSERVKQGVCQVSGVACWVIVRHG
ncbi:hypothetical protein ACOZZ3_004359, partial [Cronobacter dublinensis]